jgi:hypothetical protein
MQYSDPENTPEVLAKLAILPTIKEVKELVDNIFPKWITTVMNSYSTDYPNLQRNWLKLSKMSGVEPVEILIVEDMVFDDAHTLIRTFAELFTRCGYMVRRKSEFFPCETCGKALPSEELYDKMKDKNVIIPVAWGEKCSGC